MRNGLMFKEEDVATFVFERGVVSAEELARAINNAICYIIKDFFDNFSPDLKPDARGTCVERYSYYIAGAWRCSFEKPTVDG